MTTRLSNSQELNFTSPLLMRSRTRRTIHRTNTTPSIIGANRDRSRRRITALFTDVMLLLPLHAVKKSLLIRRGRTMGQGARSSRPNQAAHMPGAGGISANLVEKIAKEIEEKGLVTPETKDVVKAVMNSPFANMVENSPGRAGQLFAYWATPHRLHDPHFNTYRGHWRDHTSDDPAVLNRTDCIVEERLRPHIFDLLEKFSQIELKRSPADFTRYCSTMKEFAKTAETIIGNCKDEQQTRAQDTKDYIEIYNEIGKIEDKLLTDAVDEKKYIDLVEKFTDLDQKIKQRYLPADYNEMRRLVSIYQTHLGKENFTENMKLHFRAKPATRNGNASSDVKQAQDRIIKEQEEILGELERQHAHIKDIAENPSDIDQHFINVFGHMQFGERVKPTYAQFRSHILSMLNPKSAVEPKARKVDQLLKPLND